MREECLGKGPEGCRRRGLRVGEECLKEGVSKYSLGRGLTSDGGVLGKGCLGWGLRGEVRVPEESLGKR